MRAGVLRRRADFGGITDAIGLAWRAGPVRLLIYLGLTAAAGAVPVAVSWLTKLLLDRIAAGRAGPDEWAGPAVGLAIAGIAVVVLPRGVQYVSGELERAVSLIADDRLYAAVNSFAGLRRFEDPDFLDRLRLAKQSGGMTPGRVVAAALGLVRGAITVAGFLASLLILSPLMAVAVVCSAIPVLIAELLLSRRRAHMLWKIGPSQRREIFYGSLLSSVDAAKEVRLLGIGGFLRARMRAETITTNAQERRTARGELLAQGGLGLVAAVVAGAGLIWAVRAASAGRLSVGDVTMFVAAVAGVQAALAGIVTELARAHNQLLMFAHFRAVVGAGPDLPTPTDPKQLPHLRRGIELRDVWFRYSPEHPWILRGVTMTIPHGMAVGLVGLNGAGKSTLVKLLCRFYDPDRGSICWDGVDLRDVAPDQLRARIGAVFQDYVMYDLTAAENIGLGDVEAIEDRSRIEYAAQRAGADSIVAGLAHGYDTLLSRMFFSESDKDDPATGVYLSGGQGQRIALARAMMRDQCELMILDEPSSGLDPNAEHEIHQQLRAHRLGRTSLLISHRLGGIRDADKIVVLDQGGITEQGTHNQLVAAGGAYARMFAMQAQGYRDEKSVAL